MHVLILAPFEEKCLERLRSSMKVTYQPWTESRSLYDPEELAELINESRIEAVVVEADFVLEETFEEAPGLQFVGICRNATTQIDVDAATEAGVVVVSAPGRNTRAVAEMVIGLMFTLGRGLVGAHGYVAGGRWEDPVSPYLDLRGVELSGKTLGLVGLGKIGGEVARMAGALGMGVVASDPYITAEQAGESGARLVELDDLLRVSDFVSLHLPAGAEVPTVIDGRALGMMKSTAYLINTSTPQAVDQAALLESLGGGGMGGVALDVHESPPIPADHPLLAHENVILTPHVGGATDGTIARHSEMMTEALESFQQGKRPSNIINPEVWKDDG